MLRELKNSPATHKGLKRIRRKRTALIVFVTMLIAIVLLLAGIIAYNWYAGRNANVTVIDTPPKVTNVIAAPKKVAANQPVGVSIASLSTPLVAGSNASVAARTLPEATCSIEVTYNGMRSADTGLAPKAADEFGTITWSWTVEKGQPAGKWPVWITCSQNGTSARVRGDLVITAS